MPCPPASRNLTDAQLDAIGATGGLVGIVFACPFLRADFADDAGHPARADRRATPATSPTGSDPGTWPLARTSTGRRCRPSLGDAGGMPRLLEALSDAGFSEEELTAIAWGNWRRVLGAWWSG